MKIFQHSFQTEGESMAIIIELWHVAKFIIHMNRSIAVAENNYLKVYNASSGLDQNPSSRIDLGKHYR